MLATESLPIAKLYTVNTLTPAGYKKRLDALYEFYQSRAVIQINRALATKGRAVGPNDYDHMAACALIEDLAFCNRGAVFALVDLAAAYARNADDAALGKLTRMMFSSAVLLTAGQIADALIEGQPSPKRFLPAPEVA